MNLYSLLLFFLGVWADSDDEEEERQGFGNSKRRGNKEMSFISSGIKGEEKTKTPEVSLGSFIYSLNYSHDILVAKYGRIQQGCRPK